MALAEGNERSLPAGQYVEVAITDQGTGIRSAVMENIFDPYFTTKEVGNGLGLSSCYSIIEKHGGWIGAESEPG